MEKSKTRLLINRNDEYVNKGMGRLPYLNRFSSFRAPFLSLLTNKKQKNRHTEREREGREEFEAPPRKECTCRNRISPLGKLVDSSECCALVDQENYYTTRLGLSVSGLCSDRGLVRESKSASRRLMKIANLSDSNADQFVLAGFCYRA